MTELAADPPVTPIAVRLSERREEIQQAAVARALGVEEPPESVDPEYLDGLRSAVEAAVDYGIAAIDNFEDDPQIPPILISQARLAARWNVRLDTVLRRYFVGFTLFGEFILQEVESDPGLQSPRLTRALQSQAARFHHLVAVISQEYAEVCDERSRTLVHRRAERIEMLLAGEPVDTSELSYEMEVSHLGMIASGPDAAGKLRELAGRLDGRLLTLDRGGGVLWAWLGSRRRIDPADVRMRLESDGHELRVALGESGQGRDGWRLTHRQAGAAWPVALRCSERCVRYADVALTAATLQDGLLATSLRDLYIRPLASGAGGGKVLIKTLHVYLAAARNTSSAAAALGVSRQTVVKRLRAAERRLGRSLDECAADLEVALRFADLRST